MYLVRLWSGKEQCTGQAKSRNCDLFRSAINASAASLPSCYKITASRIPKVCRAHFSSEATTCKPLRYFCCPSSASSIQKFTAKSVVSWCQSSRLLSKCHQISGHSWPVPLRLTTHSERLIHLHLVLREAGLTSQGKEQDNCVLAHGSRNLRVMENFVRNQLVTLVLTATSFTKMASIRIGRFYSMGGCHFVLLSHCDPVPSGMVCTADYSLWLHSTRCGA